MSIAREATHYLGTARGLAADEIEKTEVLMSPTKTTTVQYSNNNNPNRYALTMTSSHTNPQIILSINAGSSSVKVSVYSGCPGQEPTQLATASVAGLTSPPAKLSYTCRTTNIRDRELDSVSSQEDAFDEILRYLEGDSELKEVSSRDEIAAVCHRVVHGGEYQEHRVITAETFHHIQELSDLAPLHNAPALSIVKSVVRLLPKAKNIAQFDSSFHSTIPEVARTYMIDQDIAKKNHLRKYGFHGVSYAFITRVVARRLGKEGEGCNLIMLHLGSGASACVVRNGKSLDTSMGLTPLDGLPGATRSGSVDPSLCFHLSPQGTKEMHISDVSTSLCVARLNAD